jgi:hypothetical protein
VRGRGLAVAWILVAAVLGVLLVLELSKWRSLATEGTQIAAERQRLSSEIGLKEQQVVLEMRKHSALLQEMQWTSVGGDPAAFLTRLAELAQEKRMRVMAIGSLERQTAPQFTKSWHTVQVQATFPEIRELAARVEREKGILEDVRLEAVAPAPPTGPSAGALPANELRARFRMTGLELSAAAKQIVQRAAAAGGGAPPPAAGAPPGLPVPTRVGQAGGARDPFTFLSPPPPPRVAGAGPAEKPAPPLDIKGIVSFPDGFLAIVNNQIVKVGDTVTGYRVERITETAVTVREPGANPRTVELPGMPGAAPAEPRR